VKSRLGQYYLCINCGFVGIKEGRGVRCAVCAYDDLTFLTKGEYSQKVRQRKVHISNLLDKASKRQE